MPYSVTKPATFVLDTGHALYTNLEFLHPIDEGSGTAARDVTGNHPGTIAGGAGVTWDTDAIGAKLSFSDAVGNWIRIATTKILAGESQMSFAALVLADSRNANGGTIYSERADSGNDIFKIGSGDDAAPGGNLQLIYRDDAGTLNRSTWSTDAITDGQVTFIAVVKNGTAITLYVARSATATIGSGIDKVTGTLTASDNMTNAGLKSSVGSDGTTAGNNAYWVGDIYIDMGWKGRALSDAEVTQLVANPFALHLTDPPDPAEGEVVLIGTAISGGDDATFVKANAYDGDFSTHWASNTANTGWIGVNAGVPVTPTRFRFAPRPGDSTNDYEYRVEGSLVQSASSSDFATNLATLSTLPTRPTVPFAPRNQFTERLITGATARQYLRAINTGTGKFGGNFAEIEWVVLAGVTESARPVTPVISPWGGRYQAGVVDVTFTSATTNAEFYYTVDGTTPSDSNGALTVDGTITLQFTDSLTLKVVAYQASLDSPLSRVATAIFTDHGYRPADIVYDITAGNRVEAHAGHVFDNTSRDGRYYKVGHNMNNATQDPEQRLGMGLWLFSSSDLVNWRAEGNILAQPTGTELVERPHLIRNSGTGKFIIWAHARNRDATGNVAAVGIADEITGPWAWDDESLDPDGLGYKDCTLFVDDDSTAYTVYTRGDQDGMIISKLASDYLTTTGNVLDRVEVLTGSTAESPALFKRDNVYFLVTSGGANYYNSATQSFTTQYQTSNAPLGTWTAPISLFVTDPLGTDYNAQTTQVLKVEGFEDGFIWLGDYWDHTDLYQSTYVWLPLYFPTSTSLAIGTPSDWKLQGPFTATADADIAAIKAKTDYLPSVTAGAAGGLFIAGTNAATTVTGSFTTTFTGNLTGSVGSVATGGITSSSFAASAINAAAIAPDAGTEIGAAVWASTTRLLTAGTNIVLAKGTGVTGFNDLSVAQVNAEADTALADAGVTNTRTAFLEKLDISGLVASAADVSAVADTLTIVAGQVSSNTTAITTIDTVVDAIKLKTDLIVTFPTNFSTLGINASGHITRVVLVDTVTDLTETIGTLDAAGVRAAIGMASANLDTQLGAIDDFLDTEVAAIKAQSDKIGTNASDSPNAVTAQGTIALNLDAKISEIEAGGAGGPMTVEMNTIEGE